MKNKKIIVILIVLVIAIVVIVGVRAITTKKTEGIPKMLIQKAEILDLENVSKEIDKNKAKAGDYENKWYIFCGKVSRIDKTDCTLESIKKSKNSRSTLLKVRLETEVLKSLTVGDMIVVIGNLQSATITPTLVDAIQLDDKMIQENLILAVRYKKGYFEEYFSDYQYDSSIGKITQYTKKGGTAEGTHKLSYDESGKLLKEIIEPIASSLYVTDVISYTYNEDGTVATETNKEEKDGKEKTGSIFNYAYEKDSDGRVIKKTSINITGDNYKMVYEYQYNENKVVEEKQTSPHTTYEIMYEYDEVGNIIKEKSYEIKKPSDVTITNYIYDVVAKK